MLSCVHVSVPWKGLGSGGVFTILLHPGGRAKPVGAHLPPDEDFLASHLRGRLQDAHRQTVEARREALRVDLSTLD